jgi:hypothetical protein
VADAAVVAAVTTILCRSTASRVAVDEATSVTCIAAATSIIVYDDKLLRRMFQALILRRLSIAYSIRCSSPQALATVAVFQFRRRGQVM